MPHPPNEHQGEHFTAAIARHQLALQTELKRSTSLPSQMFDASDPMLEARLCEATESIFRRLLEHDAQPAADSTEEPRLEAVAADEIADLVRAARRGAFAATTPPPALTEHADTEFDALLAETCARSHGEAQQRAAALLRRATTAGAGDLETLTRELATRLANLDAASPTDADAFVALCRRLAATVLACTDPTQQDPG